MLIFLLFNIVNRIKFICIFLGYTLYFCNFESILNTVLVTSTCCIKPPAKLPVIPLIKGWSVVNRLRYSKSNMRVFKCTYAIFCLYSFTFTIFLAGHTWFLKIFSSVNLKWETVWSLANGLLLWQQTYICLN